MFTSSFTQYCVNMMAKRLGTDIKPEPKPISTPFLVSKFFLNVSKNSKAPGPVSEVLYSILKPKDVPRKQRAYYGLFCAAADYFTTNYTNNSKKPSLI
ncbi:MAG: hypothetical protein ACOYL1_04240 [Chlamydiia bacterium]